VIRVSVNLERDTRLNIVELTFPLSLDIRQEALVAGTSSLLRCIRIRWRPFASRITSSSTPALDVYAFAFSVGALRKKES
jgi:hypothetical protein